MPERRGGAREGAGRPRKRFQKPISTEQVDEDAKECKKSEKDGDPKELRR